MRISNEAKCPILPGIGPHRPREAKVRTFRLESLTREAKRECVEKLWCREEKALLPVM